MASALIRMQTFGTTVWPLAAGVRQQHGGRPIGSTVGQQHAPRQQVRQHAGLGAGGDPEDAPRQRPA
ncbi:MAG TPA: hypothetical protein VLK33_21085, partial [Terriglobales bacterium]|nr:hypothetical protein [Terriglobales bacterium]